MKLHFSNFRIYEFGETMSGTWRRFWRSSTHLWNIKSYRRKMVALPFSIIGLVLIFSWTFVANSSALYAFLCLVTFDVLILLGDLVTHGHQHSGRQTSPFDFGEARLEVLIHFSILSLAIAHNFWAISIAVDFILNRFNEEIQIGWFLPVTVVGGLMHFFLSYSNNPLNKVYKISSTQTLLQKRFQKLAPFRLPPLFFSQNPLALVGVFDLSLLITLTLILQPGGRWVDFLGGGLIAFATLDATLPLCLFTGQVLLQTLPMSTEAQLEQSLREAMTIDGVLEFRNEFFWTLTYGQLAGMMHVRVRRDANEQVVLGNVYEKLLPLIPHLTIQITKDDFVRQSNQFFLGRDIGSPPTIVVAHGHEVSPIPRGQGPTKNLIYSTTSNSSMSYSAKSHSPQTNVPLHSFPNEDTLNISSSSSIFPPETPSHTHIHHPYTPPNPLLRPTNHKNQLLRNSSDPTDGRESFCILTQ